MRRSAPAATFCSRYSGCRYPRVVVTRGSARATPPADSCKTPRRRDRTSTVTGERRSRSVKNCLTCLDREKAANRARRERIGVEGVRAENLRSKYGIAPEEYDALREAQGFRCAICGVHEDEIRYVPRGRPRLDGRPTAEPFRLVVDHCHDSSRIRGLLCAGCNSAIGHFNDSPAAMRAAALYLEAGEQT